MLTFSVVVPTYERPAQLARLLRALAAQTFDPGRFEIIVVDDGSTSSVHRLLDPWREHLQLRLLRRPNGGPGAARNTGAREARGRLLAFTDDDCRPRPDWLEALALCAEEHPGCMLGGLTVNALPENPFATTSQVIVEAAYRYYNRDPEHARFFASNNMVVPREPFLDLGGFDTRFRIASEDRDLCDRWSHAGGRMVYAAEAVVEHAHVLHFLSFCRQHFNYGRGAQRFHRGRAARGSGSLLRELRFHTRFLYLAREPLGAVGLPGALNLGGLLALWQLANAAGFLYQGLQED